MRLTKHVTVLSRPYVCGFIAAAIGVFCTSPQAAPLDLNFGELGPSFHDVGAIDAGVNVVRAGNITASGLTIGSAITFSVPVDLQIDRMTVEFLSYSRSGGALLSTTLLSPNSGYAAFPSAPTLNFEFDFQSLAIMDPSAVTTSFQVVQNPTAGGDVNHSYALRIYASSIAPAVPEPGTVALFAAGLGGLLVASRKRQKAPT